MSTVVNMIRESLITFQTFACRTRTRAQRWNCIPCAVLKKNADGFWISVMIPKILAFLSKTPPFHQPRNNFNEGTRKIRVNWGYFPASDTNLHKLWAWAHVRDPEMRDNEAIFFWPCTRRFDDDGQEKRKEKKKKKRNSHKFESIITLALAASSRTWVSLLLGRVSSIPREDRVASFKNFELQISSG